MDVDDIGAAIGELADRADNFVAGAELPFPLAIHKQALRDGMVSLRDALRAIYKDIAGDNPWDDPMTRPPSAGREEV